MWTAKCYPLSIIVAVFSGAWPYGKLLIMIVCWLVPGSLVSLSLRKRVMIITDAIGKWSLLDSYLMIVFMVAFRLHLEADIPPPNDLDGNQTDVRVALDVVVAPQYVVCCL